MIKKRSFTLYGLERYEEIINKIIEELNILDEHSFDIKLILTEALTNAYNHGNNRDKSKPIYLRYCFDGSNIRFEVEDSGNGNDNIIIPTELSYENSLSENGRGLFIIKSLSDHLHIKDNILIMEKRISNYIT